MRGETDVRRVGAQGDYPLKKSVNAQRSSRGTDDFAAESLTISPICALAIERTGESAAVQGNQRYRSGSDWE
jgi:hypothetical protein